MAQLRITRKRQFFGHLRRLRVFIDGREVESLGFGDSKTYKVAEGTHQVQVKMDWVSSQVHRIDTSPSRLAELEVGTHYALFPPALILLASRFFYIRERREVQRNDHRETKPAGLTAP